MTLDTFQRLFAYDAWGNRATLESIRLATISPPRHAPARSWRIWWAPGGSGWTG